jgi:hypothetical protein
MFSVARAACSEIQVPQWWTKVVQPGANQEPPLPFDWPLLPEQGRPQTLAIHIARLWGALTVIAPLPAEAAVVIGQGPWQATLQARDLDGNLSNGPEAFFDTVLNVSWLADATKAFTSG